VISAAELRARVVVEGVPKGNKELGVFEGTLKRVSGLDATATLHADIDQAGFTAFEGELRDVSGRSATATLEADMRGRGFDEFAARVDSANLRTSRPITQTVRAEVDDRSFTATMARVRALKAQVDRDSGGGGLTHSAGGIVAPFGALPAAAAVASPELLALAGAATAVAGSAAEAALGVGALVGGAYGAGAVGIGGIVAVAVPAVASLKELTTAQSAYSTAVATYGKESSEAETAAKKLRVAERQAGPEAVKLAGELGHVKSEWAKLSAPGRNAFLGALADGIDHLEGKLPVLAKSANRSTESMRHDLDLFLNQVTGKGSGFDHFIGSMTDLFVHEGPMISHTLGDWVKIFEHIAEAAGPSLEMVTGQLEHWSDRILHSTEDAPKLRAEIGGLVDQTESWVHFLGQGSDLIFTIFGAGAGEGQSLVDDATVKIEQWRKGIEADPSGTESFFAQSGEEAKELTTILAGLIGTWYQEAKAIEPLAEGALHIVDALNSLKIGNVSALTVLLGGGYAIASAAKLAKTIEILKGYGAIAGLMRSEQVEQEALAGAQDAGAASADALAAANGRLAASIEGVTAAQAEQATGQLSMLEAGPVSEAEQAGQMSMFPMGGGVTPAVASGAGAAEETATGEAGAGMLAKGLGMALPAAIAAIGIGNIVTSATSGDWQDAGFEAGGALAGGVVGAFVGGPAGAMIGTGVGSVLGEVVSNLFGGSELGALQQQIIATSRHAAATFQAQKESSEALAVAQRQLRGAQSRAGEATDDLTAAERRLHRLREGDAATTAQVLGAEGQVASVRHRRAQSIREETQAYENVRLAEGASRHSLVESTAAANLAIAADQKHVDKLNQRWQTEAHGKQLTEEVTHATGKLATEEQHRADLLAKAERVSGGFRNELEGLTLAESEYGTHGHVITAQLSEVHAKIHALEVQAHANPLKPMAGELAHLRGEAGKLETKLIGFLQHSGPHLREWALSGVHSTQRLSGGFEALEGSVAQALEGIQSNTAGVLQSFGAAKIPNFEIKSMLHAFGKAKGAPGIGSVPELATGGIVPGVANGDVHFTSVWPNSFILNKKATAAAGFAEGGTVPVALEPGERVFHPDEVAQIGLGKLMALNTEVPRFAAGGLAPEPQIAGPAGPLRDLGHAAIHMVYGAAQRDIGKHRRAAAAMPGSAGWSGHTLTGKVSWFNGGATAGGGSTSDPGVALNLHPGTEGGWDNKVTRGWMADSNAGHPDFVDVAIKGHRARLAIIDLGPAGFTHRAIDVTEGGVRKLGFSPADFPTDATGTATVVGKFANGGLVGRLPAGIVDLPDLAAPRSEVLALRKAGLPGFAKGGKVTPMEAMLAEARALAGTPYVYGGGHGPFVANPSSLDCSAADSYVLHAGGLLDEVEASTGLESWGVPGPGRELTVYANPGHAWMELDGRPWGTSVGDGGAGGLGWHPQPSASYKAEFKARHTRANLGGAKGVSGTNQTTETVPGEFDGAHTHSLSFPPIPKTVDAIEGELHHWEAQKKLYTRAAAHAAHNGKKKTAQAIEQNVSAIKTRINELGRALRAARVKAAEKRITGHLSGQLGHLTGLEPGIEKAQRRYNVAEQFAQQVVDLEPTVGEGEGTSGVDLPTYLRYINQQEIPAYEKVLAAEADWRDLILGAERRAAGDWDHGKPHVGGMEGRWEGRIEALVEQQTRIAHNESAIEGFAKEVDAEVSTFRKKHPKADLTDHLKDRTKKRHDLLEKLPGLEDRAKVAAYAEKETRAKLGEGRGLFYPGGARIAEPKPPLAGTGTFEGYLEEVQGIHWPGQHEFLGGLPHKAVAGSFGGAIWSTQQTFEELGLTMAGAIGSARAGLGNVEEGGGAEGAGAQTQSELTALEKEELLHYHQREAVGKALEPVLSQYEQTYPLPYMGAFAEGGVALVGETGPEIAHLPSGTRVHSAEDTQAMLGKGDTYIVVNGHIQQEAGDTRDPIEVWMRHPRNQGLVREIVNTTPRGVSTSGAGRAYRG
jgi:hypothetical protein